MVVSVVGASRGNTEGGRYCARSSGMFEKRPEYRSSGQHRSGPVREVDGIEASVGFGQEGGRVRVHQRSACGWTVHRCVVARNDRGRSCCRREVV